MEPIGCSYIQQNSVYSRENLSGRNVPLMLSELEKLTNQIKYLPNSEIYQNMPVVERLPLIKDWVHKIIQLIFDQRNSLDEQPIRVQYAAFKALATCELHVKRNVPN